MNNISQIVYPCQAVPFNTMFVSKVSSLPRQDHLVLKGLTRDKHSSLFGPFVHYILKFYGIGTRTL
jgi:hypothetical protein